MPPAWIPDLLDRLERQPTPQLWHDLNSLLVVEGEVFCRAGLAALTRLAALAERGGAESRDEALALASSIVRTLHKYHDADDLAEPAAFATLYRVAAGALPGADFHDHFQAALSFAGYTFWAVIGLDYTDEHYHLGCPHCARPLVVVIGDYGHYCAIRHWNDGDVERMPLRPADPATLTGVSRWMHETATASGELTVAAGITYLFGDATCPRCGSTFNVATWYEAENGPPQPIDPVVPR